MRTLESSVWKFVEKTEALMRKAMTRVVNSHRQNILFNRIETLLGDPTKAKKKLGWTPKTSFKSLVAEMVRAELSAAERDELVKHHGYKTIDYHE